ncbi:MAG: 3'-5' exonuclease, partial [Clostridia bacterium]
VLRKSGYLIDVPANFRILDQNESDIIRRSVLDDLLEQFYAAPDLHFNTLIDALCGERDDARLYDVIFALHDKSRSHPNPEHWLSCLNDDYCTEGENDVGETRWGCIAMQHIRETCEYAATSMRDAINDMKSDAAIEAAYTAVFSEDLENVMALIFAETWDEMHDVAANINFSRLSPARKVEDLELKERVLSRRAELKKAIGKITEQFLYCDSETALLDIREQQPVVRALVIATQAFEEHYAAEKARLAALDYSDLEHRAVDLFIEQYDAENDVVTPTQFARETSCEFAEIMIDEYQDSNRLQDVIFRAISRDERNIVMVGDLKQAIYRFRLADPTIFLIKYKAFAPYEDARPGEPRTVTLSKNFRSRSEILTACNEFFLRTMSERLGDIDYTEREALYPGASYGDALCGTPVEFNILDLKELHETATDELPPRAREVEARVIARRIRDMVASDTLADGRVIKYSDIVILLRSVSGRAEIYEAALRALDIPVTSNKGEGLLGTIEISMILSLLAVIDNPLQDIPLVSALRSPMYAFSADELAAIRATGDGTLYDAMVSRARGTDACARKCAAFLEQLAEFRFLATELSCDALIWRVYDATAARGLIGAMPGGAARVLRLTRLYQYAITFGESGYRGLHAFLTHISRIAERGGDLSAGSVNAPGNAVTIMTIHKSKGLEFPVVFLADCNRLFNEEDSRASVLIHPQLGIGMRRRDAKLNIERETIARRAIATALSREMKSEEMRVLYVAMTRAREKLILVCTLPHAQERLDKISNMLCEGALSRVVLLGSRGTDLWFLLPTLNMPKNVFNTSIISVDSMAYNEKEETPQMTKHESASPDMVRELSRRFSYEYPHSEAVCAKSKITATALAAGETVRRAVFKRPQFIEDAGLSATERGIALHLAMQMIDFSRCDTLAGVLGEIARLRTGRFLSEAQADAISPTRIFAFFESPIGRAARSA